MIKLTVDPQVLISLQQAFPKPTNSAVRALNKYLAAIEGLIFNAIQRGITPEQRKLKIFAIPLHELANRGGRIGADKTRLHKWLKENKLETGGMNQNHIHTSSFTSSQQAKVQVGTTGNG